MPTSDLDRLFRLLVRTIEANYPAYLTSPFDVEELYQTILPYRHHRRELGFETNQDYEIALTELLSGAGGYLTVDDRMRDALQKELASRNPDPARFRDFANSQVMLNSQALASARSGGAAPEQPGASAAAERPAITRRSPTVDAPAPAQSSTAPERLSTPSAAVGRTPAGVTPKTGETCKYCGGALPAGRRITFCPHCGFAIRPTCSQCGKQVENSWANCAHCGKQLPKDVPQTAA